MRPWFASMVVAAGMVAVGGLLVGRATMLHLAHAIREGRGGARARR